MTQTRTQVYLTQTQRRRLDELAAARDTTMASLVREAVDAYLERSPAAGTALDATFGALPDLEVPSRDEWDDAASSVGPRPRDG
ncbi:MAG: CopG family transcriptional regulator [Candidatus Limnocylindrales bacterium]